MNRPKGLALTAWLMVALSLWSLGVINWSKYRNPPHHRGFFVLFIMIVVVMKSGALICIWYYFQGRNWARIAVLITSVWTLYGLRLLTHGNIVYRGVIASEGILGIFFLYWLNTLELRRFFRRHKDASIKSARSTTGL
jgi:hypothetical protein